jgi:hypothetical protein
MIIAAVAIAAYCWVYTRPDADPPIRSDGYNYYLYAASWVVYHDASLEAIASDWYGGTYPNFAGMIRWPATNRWLNRIPIGVSILMLPFVLVADGLSGWSNFPRDGFSFYYQQAAGIAGLAYFVLGLWLVRRTLIRHFSPAVTLATIVVLTFGTDLFHYGVNESTFSHAFSFALVAALVDLTDRFWSASPAWTLRQSVALGAVAGLIVLVRHTNALLLLILPFWRLDTPRAWRSRWPDLLAVACVAGMTLLPQFAYYRWATGLWVVNAYAPQGLHFTFASPHVAGALFSTQRGLFFWSPVLLAAVVGALVAKGWSSAMRTGGLVVLTANAWVIASWSEWQYGAAFGHRAFIDCFPILVPFLASCFAWVGERPRLTPAVAVVVTLMTTLSVTQMIQYWLHLWPTRDITWDQYRSLFLTFR